MDGNIDSRQAGHSFRSAPDLASAACAEAQDEQDATLPAAGERTLRILLANPPNVKNNACMLNGPNMGLLYLGGAIKQRWPKHVVRYVDARLSFEEHRLWYKSTQALISVS